MSQSTTPMATMDAPPPDSIDPARDARPTERASILDEASFRQAVVDHGPAVHRFATSRVGPDAADDVMAETFAAAWRSRAKFVDGSNNGLEAWLIGIANVLVASHRRQEQRWLRMAADGARERASAGLGAQPGDERAVERADAAALMRQARIAEAIVEMSPRERDPLLLHIVDGRSYVEISKILDLPMGTVRSRISRAKAKLAKRTRGGRR